MTLLDRRRATGVAVLAAALTMGLAQTAGAAPAYGWDDLGTKGVYYQSQYRTHIVHSGGGSLKACITTSSSKKAFYHLYEQDAEKYDAKLVADVTSGGCWTFNNLDDYVDGDNNRAEFYIGTDDAGMKRVHYYD